LIVPEREEAFPVDSAGLALLALLGAVALGYAVYRLPIMLL